MARENRRARITKRAGNRCEYCHLPQEWQPYSIFHVEHLIPRQHLKDVSDKNLSLAYSHCNFHKGPNLSGLDPDTINQVVNLFHPRQDDWDDHFEWDGPLLIGRTAKGRATIHVLAINSGDRVELREELLSEGIEL